MFVDTMNAWVKGLMTASEWNAKSTAARTINHFYG